MTPAGPESPGNKVVLFGTGTVLGVKFGLSENLPSLTLGFKRREAALVPVDKWRQPSVIASFDNLSAAGTPPGAAPGPPGVASAPASQFRVEQFFATGAAAENLARKSYMRGAFKDRAERAIGEVEKYRNEEAIQGRLALDTLACFARVDDKKLDSVWNNAEALRVLSANRVQTIRLEPDDRRRRERYTGALRLLNPGSPPHTTLLELHKTAVCDIAGPV